MIRMGKYVEQTVTDEVYRIIPSLNLSTTVLAHQPNRLLVLPTRQIRWSAWGNKERIAQTFASLRSGERTALAPAIGVGIPASRRRSLNRRGRRHVFAAVVDEQRK